jgi:transposase-like protein
MQCPRCNSECIVKSGHIRTSQRHLCKQCLYQFTSGLSLPHKKDNCYRRQALQLYLIGFSLHSIASIVRVSPASIFNWKAEWGSGMENIRKHQACDKINYHDLINYVNAKEKFTGYKLLLIDLETDQSFICT